MKGLIGLVIIMTMSTVCPESAVTYELGDRLGDNLISYSHARWISYKYDIPFRFVPFRYSEYLELSRRHKKREHNEQFVKVIKIGGKMQIPFNKRKINLASFQIKRESNILYIVSFFPALPASHMKWPGAYFEIDWKDESFLKLLREEIKPLVELPRIKLPTHCFTIAAHVRKGSGPDFTRYKISDFPMRFLPDTFFIEQIKRVAKLRADKRLYVHIFTDTDKPHELVENYKRLINDPNITFGCCVFQAEPQLAVLEDFFNLMEFDCIIRPESHFSQIAAYLSPAQMIIFPAHFAWKEEKHHKGNRRRRVLINKGVETLIRINESRTTYPETMQ